MQGEYREAGVQSSTTLSINYRMELALFSFKHMRSYTKDIKNPVVGAYISSKESQHP